MSILNVPIQLNRYNGAASGELLDGEPFFDLSTNTLYIYSSISNSRHVSITGSSNSTNKLTSRHSRQLFDVDNTTPNDFIYVGGLKIEKFSTGNIDFLLDAEGRDVQISDVKIQNQRLTTLSSEMYGKDFPRTPKPKIGQLFFKLAQ